MSQPALHTESLVRRLRGLGVEVRPGRDGVCAVGRLVLGAAPLETLGEPLAVESARFYTLGHNRLKFFSPAPLFDLPPLDVSHCESLEDVERGLRRSWSLALTELRRARSWLEQLGADIGSGARGTRLLLALTGQGPPPLVVRGEREILLPSSGALADQSLVLPAERRFRPFRRFDCAAELEVALENALQSLAARRRARPVVLAAGPAVIQEATPRRLLVLDHDANELAAAERALRTAGFEVVPLRDARNGLGAFSKATFDAVVADARLPRMNGLEFSARLHELPGIEDLPVLLLDARPTDANRLAAEALRATAYLGRPVGWAEIADLLRDLFARSRSRRFTRFSARLAAEVVSTQSRLREVVERVSRAGFSLRANRELRPGTVERYRMRLPLPLRPIELEARVVYCDQLPGQTNVRAGVHICRFIDGSEPAWLELIGNLAKQSGERAASAQD